MIPKIIHYCWFGQSPKPQSVLRCINSWKKYCPDFEIREWTENDFDVSLNQYTQQAYDSKAWGFVPDYIRLWIIYHYGGIYLDTDVQVLKNLSPLCDHSAFSGFENTDYVNFGQGFGAEAGNPIIHAHMQMYDSLQFVNGDGTYNKTPSPQYTTKVLRDYGLHCDDNTVQNLQYMVVYPKEYFCPKNFTTGVTRVTPNTYSIHQFDASWFSEEQQEAKHKRWKELRRKELLYNIRYTPNRILRAILGNEQYENLKRRLKK